MGRGRCPVMISFLLRNLPPSSASPFLRAQPVHLRKVGPGWGEALLAAAAQLRSCQAIGTVTAGVYCHMGMWELDRGSRGSRLLRAGSVSLSGPLQQMFFW